MKTTYIFTFLLLYSGLAAQITPFAVPLVQPENHHQDSVYLQYKIVDSTNTVIIYLINNTANTVWFTGFSGRFSANTEVIDIDGRWEGIYNPGGGCTSPLPLKTGLPPYTFIGVKEPKPQGDFETQVRYSLFVNNKYIKSLPYTTKTEMNNFYRYYFQQWNETIYNPESTKGEVIRAALSKIRLYRHHGDFSQALNLIIEVLEKYPKEADILDELGLTYIRALNVCKEFSDLERQAVVGAGYHFWQKIPEENIDQVTRENFKEIKKMYQQFLPRKEDLMKALDCREVNGELDCYLGCWINDFVKIHYKK